MLKLNRRRAASIALLAALPLATGCFGTFPLTKTAYRFNKDASKNEFVQSIVFWVISPFYIIAMVVDSSVLNVIEFWNEAPIKMDEASAGEAPVKTAHRISPSGDRIDVDYTFADGQTKALRLDLASPDRYTMTDADTGRMLGELARAENGDVLLYNASGSLVKRLPSAGAAGLRM